MMSNHTFIVLHRALTPLLFLIALLVPAGTAFAVIDPDVIFGPERLAYKSQLQAEPNQFTGGFEYEYKLALPSGRDNLQPALVLQYSSDNQSNISPFGYGWDVSIPYIERINRKGTNKLYTENNFFSSLDGEIKATSTSVGNVGYGPLIENGDFRQYVFIDEDYWKVTDKNGVVYTFGSASTTQIVNSASSTQIYRWMLEEVRDRNDNYVEYEYYKDGNQVYPSAITYTGHGSDDGIYRVEFSRESRSDVATSSIAAFPVVSKYRINEIQVHVNGAWDKKYTLGYGTGDNGRRSMLASVIFSGRDEGGVITTAPTTTFAYTTKNPDWTYDSSRVIPVYFIDETGDANYPRGDMGARLDDFNGDGWSDVLKHRGSDSDNGLYFNSGDGTWSTTTPTGTNDFVNTIGEDRNVRTGDIDGDGLPDFITGGNIVGVNTNRGGSFVEGGDWSVPVNFAQSSGTTYDLAGRIVDINGDGLADLLKGYAPGSSDAYANGIYLNNGTGWDATTTHAWSMPTDVYFAGIYDSQSGVDLGVRFGDFNGDGLVDMIRGRDYADPPYFYIYLNNGDGTWTTLQPSGIPEPFVGPTGMDVGNFVVDLNGDGLADFVETDASSGYTVFLNEDGGRTFTRDASWGAMPVDFLCYSESGCNNGEDRGSRFVDINADGLVDIIKSNGTSAPGTGSNGAYLANGVVPDLLQTITVETGGTISVSYTPSSHYVSGATEENPRLPLVLQTAETVVRNSTFGIVGTTTYSYGGGEYYYANEFNRRFAGFATTTVTDELGNVTKTYFHQGNGSQTSIGEYADDDSKIGKAYRVEAYDGSGNLYKKTIDRWENEALSNGRDYVKRARSVEFAYDGDADHKDKAATWSYDAYGNVLVESNYGEVNGSDDGTFTDSGSDKRTKTLAYAENPSLYIFGRPKIETVTNSASTTVAEKKFYYDSQSYGSVTAGNKTKEEQWQVSSTYIDWEWTYNSYGLATQESDPRNKNTTYTYDSNNLFVATSTNPVGHVEEFYYDLSSGKVKKRIDPNDRVFESVYDGLDRVVTEKIPDHIGTPSNLVTQTNYTYTDTVGSRRILQTDYLNSATSTDTYTYFDGFDRPVQERRESETTNTYFVTDTQYNARGEVSKKSLPYSQSGSSRTSVTSDSDLLTTYAYDPLKRVSTIANVKGTESHAYDQWEEVVTDRNGNPKDLLFDAFGNPVQVDEHDDASTYTSLYQYDAVNNLTKITDASGNVRNFTYDGLSRLTNSEDLHDTGDAMFGDIDYTYDSAGNLTSKVDAKSQTVNYAYDDINRVLAEDYTGSSGTEISYAYDWCGEGAGRLCSATTTDIVTTYAYDALGGRTTENRTIEGVTYATGYVRDRLGDLTGVTYPNGIQVAYGYNDAGQPEIVSFRPAGQSAYSSLVTQIDYAPTGAMTYRRYGNDVDTLLTYDENELYRLRTIETAPVGMGGLMEGLDDFGLDFADLSLLAQASVPVEGELDSISPGPEITAEQLGSESLTDGLLSESGSTSTTEATVEEVVLEALSSESPTSTVEGDPAIFEESATTQVFEKLIDGTGDDVVSTLETGTLQAQELRVPITKVEHMLVGKNDAERADIKANAMTALDIAGEHASPNGDLRIEIVTLASLSKDNDFSNQSIRKINGGVELFARAWRGGKPLGFGRDGSVEIERFRFFNPPILVLDSEGEVKRFTTNSRTGESVTLSYREDLAQALLQSLTQAIELVGKEEASITEGKVGNTTSIFYPGASSWDCRIGNTGSNWSTVRDASSGNAYQCGSTDDDLKVQHAAGTYRIFRSLYSFDTSAISDSDTISSATFSAANAFGNRANEDDDGDDFARLVQVTPASYSAPVADDYDQFGTTAGATDIDWGSLPASDGTYQNWSMNATGMGWISKTGATSLGLREGHDINNGAIVSNAENQWSWYAADTSGTTKDPKLVVVHSTPNNVPTAPSALQTEGQTDPTNLSDSTPEFSAIFKDADGSDTAAHYRIQVATSSSYWSAPHWDSGKATTTATTTPGNRSEQISYAGTTLASSTPYYWRIKFWDNNGAEGDYSTTTASFTLAAGAVATSTEGLQNLRYYYDNVGNITLIEDFSDTNTGKILVFGYDDLSRLTSASSTVASTTPFRHTYAYDALGNITGWKAGSATSTYTYAETGYANPHAVTEIGGVATTSYAYDNNGNVTTAGVWSYTWNYRDRLLSAGSGTATSTYAYDHEDTRIRKATGVATTTYPNQYFETAGATTTSHVYLPDGTLIASITATSTATSTTYVHADHLNSVAVTTTESGAVASIRDYYPYGAERVSSGDLSRSFLSRHADDELDLSYLTARYYDATKGQFISPDPVFGAMGDPNRIQQFAGVPRENILSDPQLLHAYGYARSNPLRWSDPDGKFIDTIADIAFIAYDAYSLSAAFLGGEDLSPHLTALGADAIGALVPGATGLGLGVRATNKALDARQAIEAGRKEQAGLGFPNVKAGSAGGETAGKRFNQSVIDQTKKESGGVCVFCGNQTASSKGPLKYNDDHSIPRVQGGNATLPNSQATCQTCNLQKGGQTTSQFIERIKSSINKQQ